MEQEASQVGLGWQLNYGGMVSRSVKGRDDFDGIFRINNADQVTLNRLRNPNYNITTGNNVTWQFENYASNSELAVQMNLFCNTTNYTDPILWNIAKKMVPIASSVDSGKPNLDGESDIFNYQAGSYNGQFMFVPADEGFKIVTLGQEPVKIELINNDFTGEAGFKITTPDGTQCKYAQPEKVKSRAGTAYSGKVIYPENPIDLVTQAAAIDWDLLNIDAAKPVITSWFITEIISAVNDNDKITFNYEVDPVYSAIALPSRIQNLTVGTAKWRITDKRLKTTYVSSISSNKGTLTFERTGREDLRGNFAKKLDKIVLKNQNGQQINAYTFNYDYFESENSFDLPSFVKKRLKLLSVVEMGNNNEPLPATSFSYFDKVLTYFGTLFPKTLPAKNSYAQDLWGLYNGEDGNNSKVNLATGGSNTNTALNGNMIPVSMPSNATIWGFSNPANRDTNPECMRLGTLAGINHSMGGKTEFTYEPHIFNNYKPTQFDHSIVVSDFYISNNYLIGGGLRTKETKIFDENNKFLLGKRFQYTYADGTNSGKHMYDMSFSWILSNGNSPSQIFSSGTDYPIAYSANGSNVGYSQVKEMEIDSNANANNGYVFHQFNNKVDRRYDAFCLPVTGPYDCNRSLPYFGTFCEYVPANTGLGFTYDKQLFQNSSIPNEINKGNGLLTKNTIFNNNNEIVNQEIYNYSDFSLPGNPSVKTRYPQLSVTGREVNEFYPALFKYYVNSHWIKLESKITKTFLPDLTNVMEQTEYYTYHNINKQIKHVDYTNSKGETIRNTNLFAHDFAAGNNVYQKMVNKNMIILPVEQSAQNQNKNIEKVKLINTYKDYEPDQILLEKTRKYIGGIDTGQNQMVFKYDADANITEVLPHRQPPISIIWGYAGQYPVAEIIGKNNNELDIALNAIGQSLNNIKNESNPSATLNNLQKYWPVGTALQSYQTIKPLVGQLSTTLANGINTSYEYDNYNRLTNVYDHNGYLIKTTNYNVAAGNNYIETKMPTMAGYTLGTQNTYIATKNFFDVLGRTTQSLNLNASPNNTQNIISAMTLYDNFGQVTKTILPVKSNLTTDILNTDVENLAKSFYGDNAPFNQIKYEDSPLSRSIKETGPGQEWHNNDKSLLKTYVAVGTNLPNYEINANGASYNNNYGENTLLKEIIINEIGNITETIANNEGNTLFEIKPLNSTETAITTHIYDAQNRLRYTLMPQAHGTASFTETDEVFKHHIFAYQYDPNGRLKAKHVPEAGWSHFVYDQAQQLVLSQTATEKVAGQYSFYKYDALGRMVQLGNMANTNDVETCANSLYKFYRPTL